MAKKVKKMTKNKIDCKIGFLQKPMKITTDFGKKGQKWSKNGSKNGHFWGPKMTPHLEKHVKMTKNDEKWQKSEKKCQKMVIFA